MNLRNFYLLGVIALTIPQTAFAASLGGVVTDISDGGPVAQANVTLTLGKGAPGASAITVFTDKKGHFQFPEDVTAVPKGSRVEVSYLGYSMVYPTGKTAVLDGDINTAGRANLHLMIQPVANIADQAPASAWLATLPDTQDHHLVNLECSGCHQFPSRKVLNFAAQIEAVRNTPGGDKKALDAWRGVVRLESWRAITKYMRAKTYAIFPEASDMQLDKLPWQLVQSEKYALTNDRLAEKVAQYLADSFPRHVGDLQASSYSRGAPLGVTPRTIIREYQLPDESFVREAVKVAGSPYIWGADLKKSRLLRLDPVTGEEKWYPVPFSKATGPHTLVPGSDGALWVSMIENDKFGRFDTKTETWKLWTLTPQNMKAQAFVGGQAAVHDISFNDKGELARDPEGRIWLTLIGLNKMAAINPDTGEVTFHDAAPAKGFSPVGASLYSTLLSSDGSCAWYAQLHGVVGCMDTKTYKNESLFSFPVGDGPRRLARDGNDILWAPLFGAGKIVKIDARHRRVLAEYNLPDRNAAPYALTWDEKRKVLWVTTSNADVLYRFNPKDATFTVYPLPRKQGYLRQISIDHETGRLIGSYGNIPAGSGPSMAIMIEVGD